MKLRLVQLVVTPVIVADDGENLSPVQAGQVTVLASELDGFPEMFRAQLAKQEELMNNPEPRAAT